MNRRNAAFTTDRTDDRHGDRHGGALRRDQLLHRVGPAVQGADENHRDERGGDPRAGTSPPGPGEPRVRSAVERPGRVHGETGNRGNLAALEDSPNAPRAVLSVNDPAFTLNNSDYLVIKSARVGMGDAAGKWTTLTQANSRGSWTPRTENLAATDYVIVLAVGSTDSNRRSLVTSGTFYTQFTDPGTLDRSGGTVLGEYRLRDRQCAYRTPVQSRGILHRQRGGTAALCAEHRGPGEGGRGARRGRDHADAAPVARLRRRHAGSVRPGHQPRRCCRQYLFRTISPRGIRRRRRISARNLWRSAFTSWRRKDSGTIPTHIRTTM